MPQNIESQSKILQSLTKDWVVYLFGKTISEETLLQWQNVSNFI
jgi:hypothetical protein